jgi:rhodanese-related sulfurtransferase
LETELNSGIMDDVDVATARSLQEQGAQLIDVREPYEYWGGHAEGALNIPLGELESRIDEVPRDRTVLLICQVGQRSKFAQDWLAARSIANTRNVEGGTEAWFFADLPMS